MRNRLSLSEVDRLVDVLDKTRLDPPPHAEIESLLRDYAQARRVEEHIRSVYGFAFITVAITWLGASFANGALAFPVWVNLAMAVIAAINLAALSIIGFFFPVLQRRERLASLFSYFDVDLSDVDKRFARERPPQNVLLAIETLERARSVQDLGPAYATVEQWSGKVRSLDFDDVYIVVVWLLAVGVGIVGGQIGIPDMWRGVILGAAAMAAFYAATRSSEHRGVRRRADDALGRWRHLVPNMRELPQ